MKSLIILTILIICAKMQNNSTKPVQIYGIRWFLGSSYEFQQKNSKKINENFVVYFNSQQKIVGQQFIIIYNTKYTCSEDILSTKAISQHHSSFNNDTNDEQLDETYIHKCIINNLDLTKLGQSKALSYKIIAGSVLFINQSIDIKINKYQQTTLFQGKFRLPTSSQLQILVIGDWGMLTQVGQKKGYKHILPCLNKTISQNQNIAMMIFTGDMAYDLQGILYYKMLKHIQVITSQMVTLVTPGNHDTLYHDDTFQLFTQSFYGPQWETYVNYFFKAQLGRLLFVNYNPEQIIFSKKQKNRIQQDMKDIFETQFTQDVIQSIKQEKLFPIVFSHYPIYCSDPFDDTQACTQNINRLNTFLNYFQKINMKIYISGHLHLYQRTKPICFNSMPQKYDIQNYYDGKCPVYIVEGSGGNNYYIQTEQKYPLKDFSYKMVYNTGFGILKTNTSNPYNPITIKYQHISCINCSVSDQFVITDKQLSFSTEQPPSTQIKIFGVNFGIFLLRLLIIGLGIAILIFLGLYIKKKDGRLLRSSIQSKKNVGGHVEMVEQNFETPVVGPKDQKNMTQS